MRPLELRLEHFGPYRDEAVLDFASLDRLFLVYGPTGAGKTTLFDALTYALYEQTPGTRGALSDQLVSHHAPEGSVPRVSLRFALGPQEWKVTRTLRHRLPKKRGEGFVEQDPQLLLEKRTAAGWEPVPGKRSELNQTLEDLIGLSAEEFAKIVVLPQGDFQRFLEASSKDREPMLKKLFPVEAYERLLDRLKSQAKAAEEARRRWEDRWQELSAQLTGPDDRAALEQALATAAEASRAAATAEEAATAELVRLRAREAAWGVLSAKRAERTRLEAGRAGVDADRARVERARQARGSGADLDRQDRIHAEGKSMRAKWDELVAQITEVDAARKGWADRSDELAHLDTRWTQAQRGRGALEEQARLWQASQALAAEEAEASAVEEAAEAAWKRALTRRTAAEASLPQPPPGPGSPAEAEAAVESLRSAFVAAQLRAERSVEEAAAYQARTEAEAADREVALWSQIVDSLHAASLAEGLVDGQPCPVCGALHHPRPAVWPEATAEAPRRLDEARALASRFGQAAAGAAARVEALTARLATLPGSPGELEAAGRALAEAEGHRDALRAWRAALDQARTELEALSKDEAARKESWQDAAARRQGLGQRRAGLTGSAIEDPTPALEALVREEASLRDVLEQARREQEALERESVSLTTRRASLDEQLEAQRAEYARLKARTDDAASALGWSVSELRAARLDETTLAGLETTVAAFDRDVHRLDGEVAALALPFPDGPPPASGPLAAEVDSLHRERQARDAEVKEREFALRDRERVEAELREVQKAQRAVESEFLALVPLTKALDGGNAQNLKLTTWVLVQALEQVTASATQRLAILSGGRYALKVQTQGNDGRRGWGLDLAVIDGHTGQERAVGTLSGGEKFLTSISLALGLADVIQERSGGLKLEAIFIDEGFGTLDEASLDRALGILADLGQQRSVGLISHVAELRQRISSRVEVVKGRHGSTIRVE